MRPCVVSLLNERRVSQEIKEVFTQAFLENCTGCKQQMTQVFLSDDNTTEGCFFEAKFKFL